MGDLSTHFQIWAKTALPLLLRTLGATPQAAEYFELGNWLRDVSQFRDPYALQLKKIDLFQEKMKGLGAAGADIYPPVLNSLFGPHPVYDAGRTVVSGAWGEWFKAMMGAIGAYVFCDNPLAGGRGLPEADFKRNFDRYYTQYYPHEHLDFPSTGRVDQLGDWTTTSSHPQGAAGPRRRMLAYLDDDIDYVATVFLGAEQDLRRLFAAGQKPTDAWMQDLEFALLRLGKASHALEDFYFHSNFVEIAFLLDGIGDRVATLDLPTYYAAKGVGSLRQHDKRVLFRRTRAPRLELDKTGVSHLSRTASNGAAIIFTGLFSSNDLMHTLDDAFEGLATNPQAQKAITGLNSTLFNYVMVPEKRKSLVKGQAGAVMINTNQITRIAEIHRSEVDSGQLIKNAAQVQGATKLFVDYVTHANQVDRTSWVETKQVISIGEVLLTLAAEVEATAQNCAGIEQKMDGSPQDANYLASDNANSAEDVGTHSLMSKDSVRKAPLRTQTDALARFAVGTALQTLFTRARLPATAPYVDWADLLRRLMCHPVQAPGDWAQAFVAKQVRPAASVFTPLTIPAANVQRRLEDGGQAISRLQANYDALYLGAATQWAKMTK